MTGAHWHPDVVKLAKKHRAAGMSYQEISDALRKVGHYYSREAVQGLMRRRKVAKTRDPATKGVFTPTISKRAVVLFNKGLSHPVIAAQLSAQFGIKVSRDATASHLARLGHSRSPEEALRLQRANAIEVNLRRKGARKAPTILTGKTPPPKPINPDPHPPQATLAHDRLWSPLPGVEPIVFMDRQRDQCAWPIDGAEYRCCGAGVKEGSSYCKNHHRWGHQKLTPVKRRAA